jgi:hypothetical protein
LIGKKEDDFLRIGGADYFLGDYLNYIFGYYLGFSYFV